MMKDLSRLNKFNFFIVSILLLFAGCKKNSLGGDSAVSGKVMHHSKAIGGASVFIKFGTKDFPGLDTNKYDSKVKCDINGNFKIDNFYPGDYYLFSVGKDYAIVYPYLVSGGISVSLRDYESISRDIAVTE